jgi:hypothetical protein
VSIDPAALHGAPSALAPHYTRFRVTERLLLTGHSHQAWPDVGFAAQERAWLDAAELVDDKWDRAFAKADRVRAGFRALLDDPDGEIALGNSTHDLVVRFLSALPLTKRPRLVTTDGEFHTVRRQLDRLSEEGIEVVRVPSRPVGQVAERLAKMVTDRTAAVLVSAVLYENAHIVPNLGIALEKVEDDWHRLPHVERQRVPSIEIVEDHPADRAILFGDHALRRGNHRLSPQSNHALGAHVGNRGVVVAELVQDRLGVLAPLGRGGLEA